MHESLIEAVHVEFGFSECDGRLYALVVQLFEIDVLEKFVFFQLFGSQLRTQPILRLYLKQILQQGLGLGGEVLGDGHRFCRNILQNLVLIL